jgi:HEPN domain-containing protein
MKTDSSNPADWILFAERDLAGVRLLCQNQLSFELCQSKLAEIVEKILKAELIRAGWFLEKTHDLQKLASHLRERDPELADRARELVVSLAEAYFSARYPGFDLEEPDWPDLHGKMKQANLLLLEVRSRL